jgi:aspartate racemase
VVIDNQPEIPDRTAFLTGEGPDPRPLLIETAQTLVDAGVDILTIPCNTAHAFAAEVKAATGVPLLDMIDLTRDAVERRVGTGRVGLLSTDGTIQTEIYHDRFANSPIEIILPDDEVQSQQVMNAIYGPKGIKSGYRDRPRRQLLSAIAAFEDIDGVILGCTELPLVLNFDTVSLPVFDPMEIMAEAVVCRAKGIGRST